MDDPEELAKVLGALTCPETNTVFWNSRARKAVVEDSELKGLEPSRIWSDLRGHARRTGDIEQKLEDRENWVSKFKYCYIALIEYEFLPRPVFVEMRLTRDDPEAPEVTIVSAHLSFKGKKPR